VQVVPVIAAGFTDSVAGAGFRSTRVGTANAVAPKREMRSASCILGFGSTEEKKEQEYPDLQGKL
jgi:hypothetical protein